MKTGRKFAIFLGVMIAAICTSIPFLRKSPENNQSGLKSTNKLSQEHPLDVPLQVKSQSNPLPTVALHDEDYNKSKSASSGNNFLLHKPRKLESVNPPPSLPLQYQSPFKSINKSKPEQSPNTHVGENGIPANEPNPKKTPPILRRHKIVDGDTLRHISEKYLGDERFFEKIYKANQDVILSPDALPLGIEIVIPVLEK